MIIYGEFDHNGHVPILITDHNPEFLLIEVRSYSTDGDTRGAIWQTMTIEQAKKLKQNLEKWLWQIQRQKRMEIE